MDAKTKLKNAIKTALGRKENVHDIYPAMLGNGENVVAVPDRPNYVYYRVGGVVGIAYNNKIAAENDRVVWIGSDSLEPDRQKVLGMVSSRRRYGEDDRTISSLQNHSRQHTYPNADTVYIHARQIMPLRVTPIGGLTIGIYKGVVKINGEFYIVESQEIDLLDYAIVADPGTRAKWLKIEIGIDGIVSVNEGTEVDFSDLVTTAFPRTAANAVAIAAIRIWSGQEAIQETRTQTDIVDLRFAVQSAPPPPAFARVLQNNLTLADTQTIVTIDYIDTADYTLTLEGDAAMEIL